jgi:N-acetylneuraminic acid mutarotase
VNVRLLAVIRPVVLSLLLAGLLIPPGPSRPAAAQVPTATWASIDSPGPAARWDHTLSADPVTGSLYLFGGRDAAGASLGDAWIYSVGNDSWTLLEGPAPSPRFGHAVAIDTANRTLYLFGGQADGETFFNDTWRFDLDARSWSEIPTGDDRPSPRYGTSAVLDGEGNLLVSHGFTFEGRFDDTW